MANCYICSGFIHSPDKIVISNRAYHNNCWSRLNRKQKLELEASSRIFPLIKVKETK